MFAAVSLKVGTDGVPALGGSIGDEQGFTSLEFNPFERSLLYKVTRRLLKVSPVIGGEAQIVGDVELRLKITTQADDEASAVAAVIAIMAAGVVILSSVWAAAGAAGLGAGVRQILIRVPVLAR